MTWNHGRAQDWIGWTILGLGVVAIVAAVMLGDRRDAPTPAVVNEGAAPREIPAPPTDVPEIGMYVDSEVDATQDVWVAHWIRTTTPIAKLKLTAADPDGLPGGVVARKVVVVGADVVLARRAEVGTKQQTLTLKKPATEIYVTYRLTGGVEAGGTVPGRVLARSVALDVDYRGRAGPVARHVSAAGEVLNVACLPRNERNRAPRPCGRSAADGWLVELRGKDRDDRLLVQIAMD